MAITTQNAEVPVYHLFGERPYPLGEPIHRVILHQFKIPEPYNYMMFGKLTDHPIQQIAEYIKHKQDERIDWILERYVGKYELHTQLDYVQLDYDVVTTASLLAEDYTYYLLKWQ